MGLSHSISARIARRVQRPEKTSPASIPISELDSLQATLNQAIDILRDEMASAGLPPLQTQAKEAHPLDDPVFLGSSRLYNARRLALASIGQLKTLLQLPFEKIVEQSFAVYDTACLDVLVQTGLLDAMASCEAIEDRQQGCHATHLGEVTQVDATKLTTILRYLASQGWVQERSECRFALSRPALELLEGKNGRKWAMVPGNLRPKIAASLAEWVHDPQWAHSQSPTETAFQIAYSTDLSLFGWLKQNPPVLRLLANAIQSIGDTYVSGVVTDYPWDKLQTSTIVDCGGGQGNLTLCLAQKYPQLKFIVQDLAEVLRLTEANFKARMPDDFTNGRLSVEVHDFFQDQPRVGDFNFVFRYVLHDWPEDAVINILQNTARAMGPQSKLLIIEFVPVPGLVADNDSDKSKFFKLHGFLEGGSYETQPPPAFIPANYGAAARTPLALGLHLMSATNARDRTVSDWRRIIAKTGLRILRVYPLRAQLSVLECGLAIFPTNADHP